jgi:streptomycin 6-kinase
VDLALSPNAAKAIDDVLGVTAGRRWLDGVPSRLAALERDWGVHPTDNLQAGTSGLVLRARCDDESAADLALKLSFDEAELEAEHRALLVGEELGISPLARAYRHRPGALATFWISGEPAAAAVSADVLHAALERIHVEAPAHAGLRELGTYVHANLDLALARLPHVGGCGIDAGHLARAHALTDRLAADAHRAFLHGDVHPSNVLTTSAGLVLCDPKGLVGDPAYDAAVWSLKADKLMTRHAWLDYFARHHGRSRVAGWAAIVGACHAVSYAFHGKRRDRIRAYADLAREQLEA